MQSRNRLLDDLAKVAGSAAGVAAGLKNEVEARLRHQFERVLDGLELVDRDEFEAIRAMAAEARAENERLAVRIADLEAAAKSGNTAGKTTRKSTKKSS
ncbi:MAG: accessory factor UbiK family protein [Alphaproteobacteria bacterium]